MSGARTLRAPATYKEGKALSDDIRDEELDGQDEVEGHIGKLDLNGDPDDEVEAHIKLN